MLVTPILFTQWGKFKDNNKGVLKDITKSSHKYELSIFLSLCIAFGVGYSHPIYPMVVIKKKNDKGSIETYYKFFIT